MSDWNDKIIKEFREHNGAVGGHFAGAHLLLLTTVGAKSGEKRTSPMMYFPNGDTRIVVASKAGSDTHPHWYHNLMKNSEVHVEASVEGGIEEYEAVASAMPENLRVVKYAEIGASHPGFAEYQTKTDRKIPLVVLNRVD
jgi:deazaflavin-dependent oxidoreductase (nitroreductase family)